MTDRRWNFEDAAAQTWAVFTVSAVAALLGLIAFAYCFLN